MRPADNWCLKGYYDFFHRRQISIFWQHHNLLHTFCCNIHCLFDRGPHINRLLAPHPPPPPGSGMINEFIFWHELYIVNVPQIPLVWNTFPGFWTFIRPHFFELRKLEAKITLSKVGERWPNLRGLRYLPYEKCCFMCAVPTEHTKRTLLKKKPKLLIKY